MPHSRRRRGGFSLLELVIVLAVVAILSGVAVPVVGTVITRTRVDDTRNEMRSLVVAIQNYFWDCRVWPTTLAQLQTNSASVAGWKGPYATALLAGKPGATLSLDQDAWGQDYVLSWQYVTNWTNGSPIAPPGGFTSGSISSGTIRSKGPDQVANNADDLVQTIEMLSLRRKETVDELNLVNAAIRAYNAQFLATAPLPGNNMDTLFTRLYDAGLLVRPPVGTTDPLRTDGWGTAYVASPANLTPCVRIISANFTGTATPPAGN